MADVVITKEQLEQLTTIFDGKVEVRMDDLKRRGVSVKDSKRLLDTGISNDWVLKQGDKYLLIIDLSNVKLMSKIEEEYIDHDGVLRQLLDIFRKGQGGSVLVIGPAGCGKTQMVLTLEKELEAIGLTHGIITLNGSEGTKERDVIGMIRVKPSGDFEHHPAGMAIAMKEGKVFYFDEANCCQPGVLVRLDQGLDRRQELTIPISQEHCMVIKAQPGFFTFATVNPLNIVGTRTMPAQLFSRFTYVIYMGYPESPEAEVKIVTSNTKNTEHLDKLLMCVKAVQALRSDSHELPYKPTVRESIACHRALICGMSVKEALQLTVINRGYHWSEKDVKAMQQIVKLQVG